MRKSKPIGQGTIELLLDIALATRPPTVKMRIRNLRTKWMGEADGKCA